MVRFFILAALCLCVNVHAATPMTLSYQGRVLANGVPFNGTGKFRFALVDGSTIVWNSENGVSSAAPTANIDLTVTNGLYAVLIGNTVNTTANPYTMAALPVSVFSGNNPLSLRVYFGDTAGTVQTLSPDQTIAAVGYAMTAASVSGGTGRFLPTGTTPAIEAESSATAVAVKLSTTVSSGPIIQTTGPGGTFEVNGDGSVLNPNGGVLCNYVTATGNVGGATVSGISANAVPGLFATTGSTQALEARQNGGAGADIVYFVKNNVLVSVIRNTGLLEQTSDKNKKRNFELVDHKEVLNTLSNLPVYKWRYLNEPETVRHMGLLLRIFTLLSV